MSSGRIPRASERPSNHSTPGLRSSVVSARRKRCSPAALGARAALGEVGRRTRFIARRADEPGDEQVRRLVVERLRARRPAGAARPRITAHAVAHRHRLDLVVRDVDRRHARGRAGCARSRRASARAASRRGSRAARPSGTPAGSRTIARPIATRWRWPPESWPRLAFEQLRRAEDRAPPRRDRGVDLGLGRRRAS